MESHPPAKQPPSLLVRKICLVGLRLIKQKRFDEAVAAFEAALVLRPDYADASNDLGTAHQLAGRVDNAMAAYRRAIELNPSHAKAFSNLGAAHMQRNEPGPAIEAYRRALEINPFNPKIRTNLAFAQLLNGDLLAGWRNYEHRWAAGATGTTHAKGREPWLGERPLRGRSILLSNEQGLGDMMQFARFVPRVADLGARIHLEAPQPLLRLFRASFPEVEEIHAAGDPVPECDEYCTVPSLALAFAAGLSNIPDRVPYLRAPAGLPGLPARFAPAPGVPRIGVAWSGAAHHHNDHNRSIPFERFRQVLGDGRFRFFSLQKEVREADAALLAATPAVTNLADRIGDFADTAALANELDLVIAVDTSVAHLAAALGKPVWVLLPFAPDWRWMLDRADSPWYPTLRLFRQPREGDWDCVLAAVRAELQARFPAP